MIRGMLDYPQTLLEFQHLFPEDGLRSPSGEYPVARRVRMPVSLQRRVGTYESREIRRACANRIGMVPTLPYLHGRRVLEF